MFIAKFSFPCVLRDSGGGDGGGDAGGGGADHGGFGDSGGLDSAADYSADSGTDDAMTYEAPDINQERAHDSEPQYEVPADDAEETHYELPQTDREAETAPLIEHEAEKTAFSEAEHTEAASVVDDKADEQPGPLLEAPAANDEGSASQSVMEAPDNPTPMEQSPTLESTTEPNPQSELAAFSPEFQERFAGVELMKEYSAEERNELNERFVHDLELNAPFAADKPLFEAVATQDMEFVRLHGENNQEGVWLLTKDDYAALPANDQLKDALQLTYDPTHVSEVTVHPQTQFVYAGIKDSTHDLNQVMLVDYQQEPTFSTARKL